jgi:Tol biopolymer transport system component
MTAILVALLLLQVQVRDDPKDWKLITTEHFDIYYPSDALLSRAREFAGWFEESRADLVKKTGGEPRRVHVFLYRSFHDLLQASFFGAPKTEPPAGRLGAFPSGDVFRRRGPAPPPRGGPGGAPCRPNSKSRALAISEPLRDRIFIHCQASDRWNKWFAHHELAHHFQFANLYPFRVPSWMIALRDPLTPTWWFEGGADYFADIFDSEKDLHVRDLADERLYTLQELFSQDILNLYDFLQVYDEGSYFWRFMDELYGKNSSRRLFEEYGEGLRIAPARPVEAVAGKEREDVQREFAENLKKRWAPIMKGRVHPDPKARLTDSREYYRRNSWGGRYSPDGKHLAWVGDHDVWPELYVDGKGILGWRRGVSVGLVDSPPSWSPDGKRIAVLEWWTNKDVLDLVDLDGGVESISFPELDELYEPAWSPDGKKIAFAALKNGTSDLYVYHLDERRLERITQDDAADSEPTWSPDGRLAWIKETEGHTVLYVDGKPVTKSWAILRNPEWSPDGKSILLSADVGGVYDAFDVDLATGRARRLTTFRGGVFYPSYHPQDGSLVFTYFQARGQDIYRIPAAPQDEPDFDQESRKPWYEQFKLPAPRGEAAEKTRVFGVNWLMFPVSSASLVLPALELSIGDRDAENTLSIGGVAGSYATGTGGLFSAGATYANTRYRPTIGLSADVGQFLSITQEDVLAFVDLPLLTTLDLGAGWLGRRREESVVGPNPAFFDSGPVASFEFNNQFITPYTSQPWDPEWGVDFGASVKVFRRDFGGDRDLNEYSAFFQASYSVTQDWILWSRLSYQKLRGSIFLIDELFRIQYGVRGSQDLIGTELGTLSLELRFPLWRDFLWEPFDGIGLGEWFIFKDLRGFLFAQGGYTGFGIRNAFESPYQAESVGAGLRFDFSFMLWPIVNARVPLRLEVWGAWVHQEAESKQGAAGFGISLGF